MKKLLAVILSLTFILATSITTFAAPEKENLPATRETVDGESPDRPDTLEGLYAQYYPEGSATLASLKAEHEAFHQERTALREAALAEHQAEKAEMQAQFQAIRADFEAGSITWQEAKELVAPLRESIEAKKAELDIIKAELDAIRLEKQTANNALIAQREANRSAIAAALQSDLVDQAAIASALANGLDLLRQHIDLDYYYANLVDALLGQ